MSRITYFSSEHVSPSHPDKVMDTIAESIVDQVIEQNDGYCRVAVDGLVKNSCVFLGGEITTSVDINYDKIVRSAIRELGYTKQVSPVFNDQTAQILPIFTTQSPDIAQGVDHDKKESAGDNGFMIGGAIKEAPDYTGWAHYLARYITYHLYNKGWEWARPDQKHQVTIKYEDGVPVAIDTIVVCISHSESILVTQIFDEVAPFLKEILSNVPFPDGFDYEHYKLYVNPTGKFTVFGPQADSGCIAEGSLITTSEGSKKIEDVKVGDTVVTESGEFKVMEVLNQGVKSLVTVIDSDDSSLTVTADHPFATLTFNGIEYVEAQKLTSDAVLVKVSSTLNPDRTYPSHLISSLLGKDDFLRLKAFGTLGNSDTPITVETIKKVLDIYSSYYDTSEFVFVHNLLSREVTTLKGVCPAGTGQCFDLNVAVNHSFVANGFLVHNCVGRKIVVDQYGGYFSVGGGALVGKDPTKVDRSGVYAARYVAKQIVAKGMADKCQLQVAYGIGLLEPVSVDVECFGTNHVSLEEIDNYVKQFSFIPGDIINLFKLNKKASERGFLYKELGKWGHIGEHFDGTKLPWETIEPELL